MSIRKKQTSVWTSIWTTLPSVGILFVLLFAVAQAILNDGGSTMDRQDITEDPEFGCMWLGGYESHLTCRCTSASTKAFEIGKQSIPARDIRKLTISDCANLTFKSDAIGLMRNLRDIQLENNSLHLEPYGLRWDGYALNNPGGGRPAFSDGDAYYGSVPTVRITMRNCIVQRIGNNAFQGKISEIHIDGCKLIDVESYAFASIDYNRIVDIRRTRIAAIQQQAFKGFRTDQLNLDDIVFASNDVPSRLFSDVVIGEKFIVTNSQFGRIRASAFTVNVLDTMEFSNNQVQILDAGAFKITLLGSQFKLQANAFDRVEDYAFMDIDANSVRVATFKPKVLFVNVAIKEYSKYSLKINSDAIDVNYNNISLQFACDCYELPKLILEDDLLRESRCQYNGRPVPVDLFQKENCTVFTAHSTLFIVLGACCIAALLIVTGLVIFFKKVYRSGSYGGTTEKALPVIMPDGRTYRETELHVIVERTDLLTTDL